MEGWPCLGPAQVSARRASTRATLPLPWKGHCRHSEGCPGSVLAGPGPRMAGCHPGTVPRSRSPAGRSHLLQAAFSELQLGQQPPGLPHLPRLASSPCPFCEETYPVRGDPAESHWKGRSRLWRPPPPGSPGPHPFPSLSSKTGPGPFLPTPTPLPSPRLPSATPQPTYPPCPFLQTLPPAALRRSPVHLRAPSLGVQEDVPGLSPGGLRGLLGGFVRHPTLASQLPCLWNENYTPLSGHWRTLGGVLGV